MDFAFDQQNLGSYVFEVLDEATDGGSSGYLFHGLDNGFGKVHIQTIGENSLVTVVLLLYDN
jgi:hypothetical protein